MLKFSACIEMIFREEPFLDRIDRVAEAGLQAFEFWGWQNKDLDGIVARKEKLGLDVAAIVGGSGIVDPASKDKFVSDIRESIKVARRLGCSRLIVTTGNELPGVPRAAQHASIVECLKAAAPLAEDAGVVLVLEPLNVLVNHKGYYLATSAEGFEILREVGSPAVKLLYDIYHQQITEGNLIATIEANIGEIGHFHVADVPGRHEPGTGEINYSNVFRRIGALGYSGFVGLEYSPSKDAAQTLQEVLALAADR